MTPPPVFISSIDIFKPDYGRIQIPPDLALNVFIAFVTFYRRTKKNITAIMTPISRLSVIPGSPPTVSSTIQVTYERYLFVFMVQRRRRRLSHS